MSVSLMIWGTNRLTDETVKVRWDVGRGCAAYSYYFNDVRQGALQSVVLGFGVGTVWVWGRCGVDLGC